MVQKLRGPSPKKPRVAEQCDVNIKSINQMQTTQWPQAHGWCCRVLGSNPSTLKTRRVERLMQAEPAHAQVIILAYEGVLLTSLYKETRELLATDLIILSHGQKKRTTPELVPPSPNYCALPMGGIRTSIDLTCTSTSTWQASSDTRARTHDLP
ncbi:hypothetical protein TNCV_1142271 [Trichonephila clavipes]|nr:hypothetical protein TNCV_1142271 [Trichonephila clavipes]